MIQTLKGMQDVLPPKATRFRAVEARLRAVFARYGYGEAMTPVMEPTELFARGLGEGSDIVTKEMYTFEDRGGRSVTLRPEGTASVVRAAVNAGLLQDNRMVKLCYFEPMFRYERPQKGRFREFWQYGVEALGSGAPALDAETIAMACDALDELGVKDHRVLLNSVGCGECRPRYVEALRVFAEKKSESALCGECCARAKKNPLRMLDCKKEECREQFKDAPLISAYWCDTCREHFSRVKNNLGKLDVSFEEAPRLVRGLDYYVRTAFEIIHEGALGAQNALLGGGRYDGLVKALGGPDAAGIGFAGGMERLLMAMPEETDAAGSDAFLVSLGEAAFHKAMELAATLRKSGLVVEMDYEGKSLKAQMKEADRAKARFAVIVGDDELRKGAATLKDMKTGEQREVKLERIAEEMKRP